MERIHTTTVPKTEIETLSWHIESVHPDYRDLPIQEGFNWPKLLGEVNEYLGHQQNSYYLVVFRSTRLAGGENAALIERLDTDAFSEAKARRPDALLHYFGGLVDEDGRAVSWCLWTDQQSAREALNGLSHRQAASTAHELYETYDVERYHLHPPADQDSAIFFEPA